MKSSKVFIAIAACCVLGVIIYFLGSGGLGGDNAEPNQNTAPAENPPVVQEQPAEPSEPPGEPEKEPQEIEQPADTGEVGKRLHEILLAADEYYDDAVRSSQVITSNGFLYNAAADMTITPEYLIEIEYLSKSYAIDGASILYVRRGDASDIVPTWEDYSEEMKVCVAAPFEGGYLMDTKNEMQAKISADDFGTLLLPYNSNHGDIWRITGSGSDYARVNEAIKTYQNRTSDFYIRYGMRDDKYAVVIASPKDGSSAIYQFVLEYDDNECSVRIPNLETVPKPKVVVNNVCPDLNVALMPNYDVSYYLGMMQKNFAGVHEALVKDGYITDEDTEIKFISATDKFLFAKYTNGQMFVGVFTDNIWVLGEVTSPENALKRFKELDKNAPDFVIIWE